MRIKYSISIKIEIPFFERRVSLYEKIPQHGFLFYTVIHGRTNRMSVRNVERIVDKYAKIVSSQSDSMPKSCYPHMMRRTRATGMYQDGVLIEMVSVILGHSNTETTKIYAAPSVEQLRENMQRAQPEDTSVKKLWEGKEDEIRRIFGLA